MKLFIYSLVNCPYSKEAVKLLTPYRPDIITVSQEEKDKFKKMNKMDTFPQIFLFDDKINIKIGGYNDTIELLAKIFKNETIPYSKQDSEKLIKFFNNKK